MNKSEKVYFCKSCGKNDIEAKFYNYLNTKCIDCKIKSVKEFKKNKEKESRDEKIENIDPDERIRYLWSEMMKEPFYRNGRKSIMDFIGETEQDISDLTLGQDKVKVECFEAIGTIKDELNLINKFQKEIYDIIDLKILKFKNEIKKEIIEEFKKDLKY